MDGNGRWAMAQDKPRAYGHKAGVDTVIRITSECARLGVKHLTLYTFSTENWNRPVEEVKALMGLILSSLDAEIFMKNNCSLRVLGDRSRLPRDVDNAIADLEKLTAKNTGLQVNLALSYSSKWEITEAVKAIAQHVADGQMAVADITDQTISDNLCTAPAPDVDLLIRTGGELRISNYLLWQIAYAELYFCDTLWPDYTEDDLHLAIEDYQRRQRRFGKTEEQVENETK